MLFSTIDETVKKAVTWGFPLDSYFQTIGLWFLYKWLYYCSDFRTISGWVFFATSPPPFCLRVRSRFARSVEVFICFTVSLSLISRLTLTYPKSLYIFYQCVNTLVPEVWFDLFADVYFFYFFVFWREAPCLWSPKAERITTDSKENDNMLLRQSYVVVIVTASFLFHHKSIKTIHGWKKKKERKKERKREREREREKERQKEKERKRERKRERKKE